jgi:hypothetical protein
MSQNGQTSPFCVSFDENEFEKILGISGLLVQYGTAASDPTVIVQGSLSSNPGPIAGAGLCNDARTRTRPGSFE